MEQINQMSAANLIAVPVLLIPCIVSLRPKKLLEMEQEANHIVVFENIRGGRLESCSVAHLE